MAAVSDLARACAWRLCLLQDAIKKKFTGIAHEIQGTDLEEMDYDYVLSKFK